MFKEISCSKCNIMVGERDVCSECGTVHSYNFIRSCMPCGKGSGLYEKFLCAQCAPWDVQRWAEDQGGYVGSITMAILNASKNNLGERGKK